MKNKNILIIGAMIFIAAASRLLPHPPNFTPLASMALFGTALLKRKEMGMLIPLVALFLSDLVINNVVLKMTYPEYYTGFQLFGNSWVYFAFILVGFTGYVLLNKVTWSRIGLSVVVSTALFFLVTNFGVVISSTLYPHTFSGVIASYIAGLPFLLNSLAGNLVYSFALFGVYSLITERKFSFA